MTLFGIITCLIKGHQLSDGEYGECLRCHAYWVIQLPKEDKKEA